MNRPSRLAMRIWRRATVFALGLSVIATAGAVGAQARQSAATARRCDAACLTAAMEDFLAKMTGHRVQEVRFAPDALIFVNTHATRLEEHPLGRVRAIRSRQVFCDPESGNVLARTGIEMPDGRIAYASTRIKLAGGLITQVESSFDDSPLVVPAYVTHLDPMMTAIVPAGERKSSAVLKAIVERYFQALTDHKPVAADFDDRCDRYHSGLRVTNTARNAVEGGAAMTCYTAVLGDRPWGPATDIHIPLVDPERGIVAGYTVLLYRDGTAPMYVAEVFKIVGGRIRMIDNIGLKQEGVKAMNFSE